MDVVANGERHVRGIELLAPAGNAECLNAAVMAGADAVYLGLDAFNARRNAGNFTLETLPRACDYAHLRGVKVYVALNIMILPTEIERALDYARRAWLAGADAFIVQDVGLAAGIAHELPEAEIHISTQMNIHDRAGIEAAAWLGASRVTLARELSLPEIAELAEAARAFGMDIEVFAHGALCVCYSGQCLMSSLIGARSANRGLCAQACRLPYELHCDSNGDRSNAASDFGPHLLSPKDLCTVDMLSELASAGVASLKVEGRMKSADYVHAVIGVYRAVLDRLAACGNSPTCDSHAAAPLAVATDEEKRTLAEAFSRGFTTAYLHGRRGNSIMSYARPNNRGIAIGRVASVAGGVVHVKSERDLSVGDVLEFWTNRGNLTHIVAVGELSGPRYLRAAVRGRTGPGDRVFRVRNAADSFSPDIHAPRIPVCGSATLVHGAPLGVSFSLAPKPADALGATIVGRLGERAGALVGAAEGPCVESARTKEVSSDDVRAHVDRMGQTPFILEDLSIELDKGVGVGFSQIHRVRTSALDALEEAILAPERARTAPEHTARAERLAAPAQPPCGNALICALATNPACARAARKAGADMLYVPALNYRRGQAVLAGAKQADAAQAGYPKRCAVVMPAIGHEATGASREACSDFDVWDYAATGRTVVADSLGALVRARSLGADVEIGSHVPLANARALAEMAQWGAVRAWLSPELTLGQIADLAEARIMPVGLTIIGAAEVMITEHCLLMSEGPCDERCAQCERRERAHRLSDEKGFDYPVVTDALGRSHLYNGIPLDIADRMPDLIAAGVTAFMVDTTLMSVDEARHAVARAVRARDWAYEGRHVERQPHTTTGHLFRGVS